MMSDVEVEVRRRVAVLTINRPESRNAISLATISRLEDALTQVAAADAEVLVIKGSGDRAFVSGGDLKELAKIRDFRGAKDMALQMRRILDRVAEFELPVIAALNGYALGGGAEVAIAADIRIAAHDIKIGFNQSQLAILPAWGGAERLAEAVGRSTALLLIASAQVLGALDAERIGLIDLVVERSQFDSAWLGLADGFANMPPGSGRSIKRIINAARPNSHPLLEDEAASDFAQFWIAEEHWEAAKAMKQSGQGRPSAPQWSDSLHRSTKDNAET